MLLWGCERLLVLPFPSLLTASSCCRDFYSTTTTTARPGAATLAPEWLLEHHRNSTVQRLLEEQRFAEYRTRGVHRFKFVMPPRGGSRVTLTAQYEDDQGGRVSHW